MDFDSLPRRELQALCKSNGIRANMSNAAMAEALRCLPSVSIPSSIPSVRGESLWTIPMRVRGAFGSSWGCRFDARGGCLLC